MENEQYIEEAQSFRIDNDNLADWALRQIKDREDERDRLILIANNRIDELTAQIKMLQEACERDTSFLKSELMVYFSTIKPKETKTQASYKLLSGSLVYKKPSYKIEKDADALLEYLKQNDPDFVKVKEDINWAEYKKRLAVVDGEVIDTETGEKVEACRVEDVDGEFKIKY